MVVVIASRRLLSRSWASSMVAMGVGSSRFCSFASRVVLNFFQSTVLKFLFGGALVSSGARLSSVTIWKWLVWMGVSPSLVLHDMIESMRCDVHSTL